MNRILRTPSAWVPILLSLVALSLVIGYLAWFGVNTGSIGTTGQDEGATARAFQILIVAQTIVSLYFAVVWVPRAPTWALWVLMLQIVAVAAALAPIFYFEM